MKPPEKIKPCYYCLSSIEKCEVPEDQRFEYTLTSSLAKPSRELVEAAKATVEMLKGIRLEEEEFKTFKALQAALPKEAK